jgi:hypothetical protein
MAEKFVENTVKSNPVKSNTVKSNTINNNHNNDENPDSGSTAVDNGDDSFFTARRVQSVTVEQSPDRPISSGLLPVSYRTRWHSSNRNTKFVPEPVFTHFRQFYASLCKYTEKLNIQNRSREGSCVLLDPLDFVTDIKHNSTCALNMFLY